MLRVYLHLLHSKHVTPEIMQTV